MKPFFQILRQYSYLLSPDSSLISIFLDLETRLNETRFQILRYKMYPTGLLKILHNIPQKSSWISEASQLDYAQNHRHSPISLVFILQKFPCVLIAGKTKKRPGLAWSIIKCSHPEPVRTFWKTGVYKSPVISHLPKSLSRGVQYVPNSKGTSNLS